MVASEILVLLTIIILYVLEVALSYVHHKFKAFGNQHLHIGSKTQIF